MLGRYLRMLVYDPRYSRFVIGVPGSIFVFAGVLILVGRAFEAGIAILLILGTAFLIRGFSLDKLGGLDAQQPSVRLPEVLLDRRRRHDIPCAPLHRIHQHGQRTSRTASLRSAQTPRSSSTTGPT